MFGGVHELRNRLIDIADKAQARIRNHFDASGKAPVRHVVLHDLDGVLVLDLDSSHLVEGHGIPVPHQTHLASRVVVEQRGFRCLAAAHERGVRGEFTEKIGFPGPSRPEFDKVVIRFN
jgi:hypothetical protein